MNFSTLPSWVKDYPVKDSAPAQIPGLVGEIINHVVEDSVRPQPLLALQAALQTMSAICCKNNVRGASKSQKLSLITLGIALSGSGKETNIDYMKKALNACKASIYSGISSDVDAKKNLAFDLGSSSYVIDEFGQLLAKLADSRNHYNSAITNFLLESFSNGSQPLGGKHKRELLGDIEVEKKSIKKACRDDGMPDGSYESTDQWKAIQARIDYIENGMQDPRVNVSGFSTPADVDGIVSKEFIARGLIARMIIFRCPEHRVEAVDRIMDGFNFSGVKAEPKHKNPIEKIKHLDKFLVAKEARYMEGAQAAIKDIAEWQESQVNDEMGANVSRIVQLVDRIATVIAVGNPGNKPGDTLWVAREDVCWAFSIVIRSFKDILSMQKVNSEESGLREKVIHRILQIVSEDGTHASKVYQQFKSKRWVEDIENVFQWSGMGKDFDARSMPNYDDKVRMVISAFIAACEEEGLIRVDGKKAYKI